MATATPRAPAKGDWESVRFTQTSGGSRLAHVHFRYGGSNSATGALVFDGAASHRGRPDRDGRARTGASTSTTPAPI